MIRVPSLSLSPEMTRYQFDSSTPRDYAFIYVEGLIRGSLGPESHLHGYRIVAWNKKGLTEFSHWAGPVEKAYTGNDFAKAGRK